MVVFEVSELRGWSRWSSRPKNELTRKKRPPSCGFIDTGQLVKSNYTDGKSTEYRSTKKICSNNEMYAIRLDQLTTPRLNRVPSCVFCWSSQKNSELTTLTIHRISDRRKCPAMSLRKENLDRGSDKKICSAVGFITRCSEPIDQQRRNSTEQDTWGRPRPARKRTPTYTSGFSTSWDLSVYSEQQQRSVTMASVGRRSVSIRYQKMQNNSAIEKTRKVKKQIGEVAL